MTIEQKVTVEGQVHTVVLSDDHQALQAADAAGRAVIGLWDRSRPDQNLSPARFAVERPEDADAAYMERAVRRRLGLPWVIGVTRRLIIREFTVKDFDSIPVEPQDTWEDRIFTEVEKLEAYIRNQYGYYQHGIWAVVRKEDQRLIGKAGLSDLQLDGNAVLELGYHIFKPYRKLGYGTEACREILRYGADTLCRPVYARIDASNEASVRLAVSCGFHMIKTIEKKCSGSWQRICLYGLNC